MKTSRESAFTLIELVVVIAILGVLAAVALPRFAHLTAEARKSTMLGIAGNARSAVSLVYAKAATAGLQSSPSAQITMDGVNVQIAYGYPTLLSIVDVLRLDPLSNFNLVPTSATSGYISPVGASNPAACKVSYTQASSSASALVQDVTSDCS